MSQCKNRNGSKDSLTLSLYTLPGQNFDLNKQILRVLNWIIIAVTNMFLACCM